MRKNIVKRLILIVLLHVLLSGILHTSAYAADDDIFISIPICKENGIYYTKDAEGWDKGIADFYIDNGEVYLLSNIDNSLYVYHDNKRIDEIHLDELGIKAIRFAINENRVWIYDNTSKIILLENWKKAGEINLYDFTDSEAIEDFRVSGENLYLTVATFAERDYVTYRIGFSGGSLICEGETPGRIVEGERLQNPEEAAALLCQYTEKAAENNGLKFEEQQGLKDLGEAKDGNHYYLSSEIIIDGRNEYYVQRVYCFDRNEKLLSISNIPAMIPTSDTPVKMIDGNVYVLDTERDCVKVQGIKAYTDTNIRNCQQLIEWNHEAILNNRNPGSQVSAQNDMFAATASVTRFSCIQRIDSYCTPFTWSCSSANLLPKYTWVCPRYIDNAGAYNSMPYCWGGYDTPASFNAQIQSGANVGNINTHLNGHLTGTAGCDCSGLVSRALILPSHWDTGTMLSNMTPSSYSNIKMSDLFLKQGHVMMYYYKMTSGSYCLFHCTIENSLDRAVMRSKPYSQLTAYSVYTYSGFSD